jgi:hypothetical protein
VARERRAGDAAARRRVDVAGGVARGEEAVRDGRVVRPPRGQGRAEPVEDGRARELRPGPEVALEDVHELHRVRVRLEAEPDVDLPVSPREVPEVAELLGRLEHDGVGPLDGVARLDDLPVRRAEPRVRDVRVEVRPVERRPVLGERERARTVDRDRGLVGDRLARPGRLDPANPSVVVLSDVGHDRVELEVGAGSSRLLEEDLA